MSKKCPKMVKIAKQMAKNGEKQPEISNIGQKSGYVIYGRPLIGGTSPNMNSGNYRQEEKKILDQILDREVYDARMRPNGYNASDGPTIVNVNLYFRSFEKIDDVKMVRFLIYYTTLHFLLDSVQNQKPTLSDLLDSILQSNNR